MGVQFLELDTILDYIADQDSRSHIDARFVRNEQEECFVAMEQLCEKLHHLFFLEAQLHSEEFHRAKGNFRRDGQDYGFLSSFVRQHKGSNELLFRRMQIQPRQEGQQKTEFIRYPIPRTTRRGSYSKGAFQKYSSHKDELTLTLLTEEHFDRLRQMGSVIKSVLRQLKSKKMGSRYMDAKIRKRTRDEQKINTTE